MMSWLTIASLFLTMESGIRKVQASPCERVRINIALGITTQLLFEQEPKLTLYADKDHFQIQGTKEAPKTLAIIPRIASADIDRLITESGRKKINRAEIPALLDPIYKTNLFVFFDHHQQLIFELRFVSKEKADYIVHVTRIFPEGCPL